MKLEGHAHTWRFPRQAAQGIPTAVNLRALHSLHFLGPEGADSVHLSRRGAGWGGGGGVVVVGSTCSLVWERRTTCWVTMRVPDPNIPIVRRPLPVREGRDLDHHVTACSEGAGVRGHAGGGGLCWACFRPHFCWGGGGAAKGLLPCFLVPKGDQPTACTLALWWLKFGPTRREGGGGGRVNGQRWSTLDPLVSNRGQLPADRRERPAVVCRGKGCLETASAMAQ